MNNHLSNKKPRARISVYLSQDLKDRINKEADGMGLNLSAMITVMCNEYLKQSSVVNMIDIYKKEQL